MKTVKIHLHGIYSKGRKGAEIPAMIVGDIAIHRFTNDGEGFGNTWSASHIPTGSSLASIQSDYPFRTRRDALAWARACWEACEADWDIVRKHSTFGLESAASMHKEGIAALSRIVEWAREHRQRRKAA